MTINLKKIFTQNKLLLFFILLFIFIQIIISSIYPYLTKLIIDHVLLKHQLEDLKKILLLTLALILIQLPINVGVSYLCAKWTQTIIYRLREQLGILFITHKENAQKNGLFINTLSNDCELIGNQLLTIILNSVPNILLIFLYVLILFQLNKKLTFWALLIIPLFLIIPVKKSYLLESKRFIDILVNDKALQQEFIEKNSNNKNSEFQILNWLNNDSFIQAVESRDINKLSNMLLLKNNLVRRLYNSEDKSEPCHLPLILYKNFYLWR